MDSLVISNISGTVSSDADYPIMHTAANEIEKESASSAISKHDKLIRFTARSFAAQGVLVEDHEQVGRMTMLAAYESWRGDASLWTYAHLMVKRDMGRYAASEKGSPSNPISQSGLDEYALCASEAPQPDEALEIAQGVSVTTIEFSGLKEMERKVLRLRFGGGMDVRSIADELEMSKSEVDRIYHAAIATLRARVGAKL